MISRIGPVVHVQRTGAVDADVFRSPLIPSVNTNALSVQAAGLGLLATVGTTVARRTIPECGDRPPPVAVLGSAAASGSASTALPGERIWLGGMWFYLAGILDSATLAEEIDASVLVGFAAAERYLGFDGHPDDDLRPHRHEPGRAVQAVLASTANPEAPNEVTVSQPSAALIARAQAQSALNGLFLGLGAVSLLVGAVGVGNIMLIACSSGAPRSACAVRSARPAARSARSSWPRQSCSRLGGAVGVVPARSTAIYASTEAGRP